MKAYAELSSGNFLDQRQHLEFMVVGEKEVTRPANLYIIVHHDSIKNHFSAVINYKCLTAIQIDIW